MAQVLHGRATTTYAIRKEIQESEESVAQLANRLGVNPKTVQKWRKRTTVEDAVMGAKKAKSSLSELEQTAVCQFRKSTGLSLDDCFMALKGSIPSLTRSNLHRCLQKNGLSKPKKTNPPEKKTFKSYSIGYVHVDISEIHLGKDKYYLFVAIERVCKFAYVELHDNQRMETALSFMKNGIERFPFRIHRILTDNGAQFTYRLLAKHLRPARRHPFDQLCQKHGIIHKLTQFRHPWTNGQVERFNGTLKEYTTKTYHYDTLNDLKVHLYDFEMVYNFSRKLKILNYRTPYEHIIQQYQLYPKLFHKNPYHYLVGLNM